jgi:hypothetical protein
MTSKIFKVFVHSGTVAPTFKMLLYISAAYNKLMPEILFHMSARGADTKSAANRRQTYSYQ